MQDHPNTVSKEDEIVSHVPFHMAQYVTKFLKGHPSLLESVLTGELVTGSKYIFYGNTSTSIKWLKENIEGTGLYKVD